jgi:hypothetical protein
MTGLVVLLACPAAVAETPLTPEQLAAQSKLVVVGRVASYGVHDEEEPDGSKSRYVMLRVDLEAVPAGAGFAKPGDSIWVTCRVVVRSPRGGEAAAKGHDTIPGLGGRAKFYLGGESLDIWTPLEPNGIERLDDTPAITFEMEPHVSDRLGGRSRWALPLAVGVALLGLLAFGYYGLRRAKPAAGRPTRSR